METKENIIKVLKGHSGCEITLLKNNDSVFVRKKSGSTEYNNRLKKQFKKQKQFQSETLYAPEVFDCGFQNKLFYFDMEYVHAKALSENISYIIISDIPKLMQELLINLSINNIKPSRPTDAFNKKIQNLKVSENIKNNILALEAFRILENFDWNKVEKSACHGDLTLENMLITPDKKIYLIDFLDSFYNSWMFDVAKLLQDLEFDWSGRKSPSNSNRTIRLQVAKDTLIDTIYRLPNGEEKINTIYHLLLLNILRIYPYSKEAFDIEFLDNLVYYLVSKLREE